ncbi:MAG: kelch repeat-containing protein, partial [Anaerolineae bacterium]
MVPVAADALSKTELEVLRLVATGATNREIARARGISEATVKKHLTNINAKLGTGNRTEAMRRSLELGLVEVQTPQPEPGAGQDAARRLAHELERSRMRARRARIWAALAVAVALAIAALAVWRPGGDRSVVAATATPSTQADPRWIQRASLPSPRSGVAAVVVEGRLYAIGGAGAGDPQGATPVSTDTLVYDPQGLEWRALAPKPHGVHDAKAKALQGRAVVPGGCRADGQASPRVEVYDPGTNTWSAAASLPEGRCGYGLAEYQGRLYLFGGRRGDDPATASDEVWRYDAVADRWLAEAPMPQPRSGLAAVLKGDDIHVLGGLDAAGRPTRDHWVFKPNPETVPWDTSPGPQLPEARAGLAAASVAGRLYVVGGGSDRPLDAVFWLGAPGADWRHDP